MRTTLDIDDEILQAVKDIAAVRGSTAGKVISELARKGLAPPKAKITVRNGVPLLRRREGTRPLTMEEVNELRDSEE